MKLTKNTQGSYNFTYKGNEYYVENCSVLRNWTVYGFGARMVAGGETRKEALENFKNFMLSQWVKEGGKNEA